MHWALTAYVFFNVLLSKPELLADDRYKVMSSCVIQDLTSGRDYDAQSLAHREFLWGRQEWRNDIEAIDPFEDMDKLHEYLKMCFRLLYRYDTLVRECGQDLDWEGIVAQIVTQLWRAVKVECGEDEQGRWTSRFA
jgi:hypothetical protein